MFLGIFLPAWLEWLFFWAQFFAQYQWKNEEWQRWIFAEYTFFVQFYFPLSSIHLEKAEIEEKIVEEAYPSLAPIFAIIISSNLSVNAAVLWESFDSGVIVWVRKFWGGKQRVWFSIIKKDETQSSLLYTLLYVYYPGS